MKYLITNHITDYSGPVTIYYHHDAWGDNPKAKKGVNIKVGDRIRVAWPDGSLTEESLLLHQNTMERDMDNGYGKWWRVRNVDINAYFTYDYRGKVHTEFLKDSRLTWEKLE